jgi:lipid-A-disaccharide synthase-like uncharacterized protein
VLALGLLAPLVGETGQPSPGTSGVTAVPDATAHDPVPLRIRPLPAGVRKVTLERQPDGGAVYVLRHADGTDERVSPDELARRLYADATQRRLLFRILNITSLGGVAWVAVGFLAQAMFAGRMVVQWLASEHHGQSVVPVAFWWMSLGGAGMLLVYFLWRRDIVGVVGQSTGFFIYARNLWLIRRERLGARPVTPGPRRPW